MKQSCLFIVAVALAGAVLPANGQPVELVFRDTIKNTLGESVVFDAFTSTAFGNAAQGVEYSTIDATLQFGTLGAIDLNTYVTTNIAGFTFGGVSGVDTDPLGRGFGVAAVINNTGAGSSVGAAVFFNTISKTVIGHQLVGFHPDMVTFNPTGTSVLVANESDNRAANGDSNPGSISNINVSSVTNTLDFSGVGTTTVGFSGLSAAQLTGVRDHGAAMNRNNGLPSDTLPNINRIEPEYISVSGNIAYVTLQEANSVGVFDIPSNTWTGIQKLAPNLQTIDARNNSSIGVTDTIATLAQPDAIVSFTIGSNTYYATANEGDYRDNDVDRRNGSAFTIQDGLVGGIDPTYDVALDALYSGNWQASAAQGGLGGTRFLNNVGDLDGDGDIDQLTIGGSRSMSIFDAATGMILFDTNDLAGFGGFETWIAANDAPGFNINQSGTTIDTRSRDKGPEPEALALGEFDGDLYALVGMERTNHLFLFRLASDVGFASAFDSSNVEFIDAIRWAGEFGPETIDFVSATNSPSGVPFFLVGSESSTSWAIYTIPEPATSALVIGALGCLLARRRRRA